MSQIMYNVKYVLAEHIPIIVGYIWQSNFKYYFGLDCIKRFARDLLEIETENGFKRNEKMAIGLQFVGIRTSHFGL